MSTNMHAHMDRANFYVALSYNAAELLLTCLRSFDSSSIVCEGEKEGDLDSMVEHLCTFVACWHVLSC